MSRAVFGGRWHYFEAEIKDMHEWDAAWSIVKQQMNVERAVLPQTIFLQVVEKSALENPCATRALGLLFYTAGGEPLAVFLRALGFSE